MNRRSHAACIEITSDDLLIVEGRLARAISLLPLAVLFIGTLLWGYASTPVTTSNDVPLGLPKHVAKAEPASPS